MAFNIAYIENEIIDQFLNDDHPTRPWIIGFSGGKDSTLLLQIVWNALKKIKDVTFTRDIYVVCNDTLVENPKISSFIDKTLMTIEKAAVEQDMPIRVNRTYPKLEDTFWVKLIGLGYPAPNNVFRWCTERLKISPTTRFITEQINEKGEAIILLGTRHDESSHRSQSIKKNEIKGKRLKKHLLPNAYVFAPIKDVTTNDLWQYLMQVPPPWGGTHKELVTLYKNANSGDCPLVIDKTTPSCGHSRFGCWVCTVVKKDKSMEALIINGEEWMEPLIEIRNLLSESRDSKKYREKAGRDGIEREGRLGPYIAHFRAFLLRKLLEAQKSIQDTQGDFELISKQELIAIQISWYRDAIFNHSVAEIYNKIFNCEINMTKVIEKFKQEEELLKKTCNNDEAEFNLIQKMLSVQKTKTLMLRKRGLLNDIENVLDAHLKDKNKN
jgi:DNA sulfur modification protein DndC